MSATSSACSARSEVCDSPGLLGQVLPEKPYELYRVQSGYNPLSQEEQAWHPDVIPVTPGSLYEKGTPEVLALKERLESDKGIVILGTTPHQIHNLALSTKYKSKPSGGKLKRLPHSRWFDLVVIDEASQMDVAASTLLVSKRRDDGAIVLAGDNLQLAPIHKADAPTGLEHLVGSVYGFARHRHGVEPMALQVNYRSNETLVSFVKRAATGIAFTPTTATSGSRSAVTLSPLSAPPIGQTRCAGRPVGQHSSIRRSPPLASYTRTRSAARSICSRRRRWRRCYGCCTGTQVPNWMASVLRTAVTWWRA